MKGYKPKTQKQIQHLSRAINKIDEQVLSSTIGLDKKISKVEMKPTKITYNIDGKSKTIDYNDINTLSKSEQSALGQAMNIQRYELREQRVFEQLKEKGKLSWQLKRSFEKDNQDILQAIENFEKLKLDKEEIKSNLEDASYNIDFTDEFEKEFQDRGSDFLYDFYDVHETKQGFNQLNALNWNLYKYTRGLFE